MDERCEEFSDVGSTSRTSLTDEDDVSLTSGQDEQLLEEPLTEKEIEELVSEFLEVESKAAEAQEALEKESLAKVEIEVREELAETLHGEKLEIAVANEMETLKAEWEIVLDELEDESAHLLEQLDGIGIDLPRLYKLIESEAPNGCHTDAWKKRIHWVGSQVTHDLTDSINDAEKILEIQRPVRRKLGKLLEEGASGYLQKKFSSHEGDTCSSENSNVDWYTLNKIFSNGASGDDPLFGSKHWSSVYLANTPQQAAVIGLDFPGVNEVEEIDDVDRDSNDPFVAAAIANEREMDLSEEQKKNFKKVKEEDDAKIDKKLHSHLKKRRRQKKHKQEILEKQIPLCDVSIKDNVEQPFSPINSLSHVTDKKTCDDENYVIDEDNNRMLKGFDEPRGSKRSSDSEELINDSKKSRTAIIDSGDESLAQETSTHNDDCDGLEKINSSELGSITQNTLNENFSCTACDNVIVEVHAHPVLNVIICGKCKCLMEEKLNMKLMDPECSEGFCTWCGRNADLVSCKSCKTLFCAVCVTKNVGVDCLSDLLSSGWHCCCCCPNLLQSLTADLARARGAIKSVVASGAYSNNDSDNSDSDVDGALSFKRKHKKTIRRILDDAELGEETKRKIAIEMERQERLKSLQVQFSARSKMMSFAGTNGSLSEDATVEVLGDASTGYIVNVVRENGEEAVRIPASISVKLKAHQVSGIRFMWENIMQSIRKVKSGDKGLGCILAHTMGLGKTFQVIAFLYTAMRSVEVGLKTALIVTPVNVLHNWRQEFLKWRPSEVKSLRVVMLEDVGRDGRLEWLKRWRRKGGVFLIGYTAFRNLSFGKHVKDRHTAYEISQILQDGPDILVCDEAHMIKNTKADITQALKQVKCQRRIALTGSPLQNNLMEYYCMVDFVREGFLGSSHEFRNRFQNPIEQGQHTNSTLNDVKIMNQRSHILYEQLKGFVQRMDVNVAKKDLPPKTVFVISVKLSPLQRKLYKRFLDEHGFTKDRISGIKLPKRSFFAGYQALAQIWNHPGILQITKEDNARRDEAFESFLPDDCSSDDNNDFNSTVREKPRNVYDTFQSKNGEGFFRKDWWNGLLHENNFKELDYSGKMVLLLEIIIMCSDLGDKALVFSQSIPTLDLIELYLSRLPRKGQSGKLWKKGKDWYRLDGRTESSERQRLVERFNEPSNERVKCTLISTRAGSLGINLHSANRVIIVDGSWNPTYDLQAIYRAWRYGQRKPVFVYRLLAHGTMEEKIYKRQVTKEGLAARVVDRQQVHRTISKEEMSHLFEFGDEESLDASELNQGHGHGCNQDITDPCGNLPKQEEPLSKGSCPSDKLMESLLSKHQPRWIINYHEHETLLQENEEEKLSKEEQDKAWEVYQKTLEWEEQQKVPLANVAAVQKQDVTYAEEVHMVAESRPRNRFFQRKCTILSHMLTLRSQGTKVGSHAVCGECAQEISWDELNNRDGRRERPTYVV